MPLDADESDFFVATELDGRTFGFRFTWNHIDEHFEVSLFDADESAIVLGQRLLVGVALFDRYHDARKFGGVLQCVDTQGKDAEPGLGDLGRRHLLIYTPEAEV